MTLRMGDTIAQCRDLFDSWFWDAHLFMHITKNLFKFFTYMKKFKFLCIIKD